ncbi:MAG: ABC transporter permease, partial [Opitutaceae bacterium]
MTLARIIYRSLRQHAFTTIVAAASIALAGGLAMTVWLVKAQAEEAFTRVNAGFDAVLGARGSKLQLVLNAIFHLEASPGNIRWSDYEQIAKHPAVAHAIPIAVGDNFRGYRLVGTPVEKLAQVQFAPERKLQLAAGRLFEGDAHEAVAGSFAARKLGLRVGDMFHPSHGFAPGEHAEHEEEYTVCGILEPTNTPLDRVIL